MNGLDAYKNLKGKYICIDIDGVLCMSVHRDDDGELDYKRSFPIRENIDIVNHLYAWNNITLFTARGNRTGKIDWREFTIAQLSEWGVSYHSIRFDKPHYDFMVDDRAFSSFEDFEKTFTKNQ